MDEEVAGYGTNQITELMLPDLILPNFEMMLLLQEDKSKMMYDSSILLDDILDGVRKKPGESHIVVLQPPFTIKVMTGDSEVLQPTHKVLTRDKQVLTSLKIAAVEMLSKPTPFKLLVSRERITSSQ